MSTLQFTSASTVKPNPNALLLTVCFDGACPVRSAEIAHYRRQPGAQACQWVDAAICADDQRGPELTRDVALRRFHGRRADGRRVHGTQGFAALWSVLSRTAWLARVASFGPMPALLDAAYSVFLAVRPLCRKSPARVGANSAS